MAVGIVIKAATGNEWDTLFTTSMCSQGKTESEPDPRLVDKCPTSVSLCVCESLHITRTPDNGCDFLLVMMTSLFNEFWLTGDDFKTCLFFILFHRSIQPVLYLLMEITKSTIPNICKPTEQKNNPGLSVIFRVYSNGMMQWYEHGIHTRHGMIMAVHDMVVIKNGISSHVFPTRVLTSQISILADNRVSG